MNEGRNRYDVLIIGTGPAGTTAAVETADAGLRTAVVDRGPFGGTCVLRGCNPKKVLTEASGLLDRLVSMEGKGIAGENRIDWSRLIEFKSTFTDPAPAKREKAFEKRGIETFHGRARFTGRNAVEIDGRNIGAEKIIIASGGVPRKLGIEGEQLLTTSAEFLETRELPGTIIFLGGGYIAFEFAHAALRSGSSVTILEASKRPLAQFDGDLVEMLADASLKAGITVITGAPVLSLRRIEKKVVAAAGEKGNQHYEADMVVHGAGRVPALDGLDLEKGEISADDKGIEINEYLQSVSNPDVYIAGDANSGSAQLTPIANMEALVAARNIIGGPGSVPDYSVIPSVAYTSPPIAAAGISEEEARKGDQDAEIIFKDTSGTKSTRRRGLTHSAIKLIADRVSGRLLGAHLLGYGSEETINTMALAISMGATVSDLTKVPWAFPTVSSSFMWYANKFQSHED
jgi:glutathione reductase (NADPH)